MLGDDEGRDVTGYDDEMRRIEKDEMKMSETGGVAAPERFTDTTVQ